MAKTDRRELRVDEKTGLPIFIIVNQVKKFCLHHIEELEENVVQQVKMRTSQEFMDQLNERVFDLIEASSHQARSMNRKDLRPEDIPQISIPDQWAEHCAEESE